MKKIRIVIVDDHTLLRMGLSSLFKCQPDMTVVGQAEDGEEAVRVQYYIVGSQELTGTGALPDGVGDASDGAVPSERFISSYGKQQEFLPVFLLTGNVTACKAGGPLVLVIQPGDHIFLLGFFVAGFYEIHEFVGKILGGHAHTGVHVEAAHTHLFHVFDLFEEFFLFQIAVPCPERSTSVLGSGFLEQSGVEFRSLILRI